MKKRTGVAWLFGVGLMGLSIVVWASGGLTVVQKMEYVTYKADRTIVVKGAGRWGNPDVCDKDDRIILIPSLVSPDTYKELYAAILAAKLGKADVQFKVDGCQIMGGQTYPHIFRMAIF